MSEFKSLIDQLYREEVEQARSMTPAERFGCGMEIIEENMRWARCLGEVEMERRYVIARKLKEYGCYGPPVPRAYDGE